MGVTELTRELVSIPSHEDETAAGDAIVEWLDREMAATVTRDEAGNVIAHRAGDGGDQTLALVGHHDVVSPADAQLERGGADEDRYQVTKREGRLYGRGTADMKGAVAAAMLAFRDADPHYDLVFASFVGEEVGGEGARAAVDCGFDPDYAVVGEGSTGYSAAGVTDVAVAHLGRRGLTITAQGTAAHASEPDTGENAIYRATDAVDTVRKLPPANASVPPVDRTVSGSLQVTEIDGGTAWNVIPDRCSVTVDERTIGDDRAPVDRVESIPGVSVTVDQDLPPMVCSDRPFAEAVLRAAAATQDGDPQAVIKPHATDAGWLSNAGTTCVVCGPAEPGEAHTDDESVSIDVLERCYRIYRGIAESTW